METEQNQEESLVKKDPVKLKNYKNYIIITAAILALLGLSFYAYTAHEKNIKAQEELAKLKSDPQAAAQTEINNLLAEVGKLIILPQNEQPAVATVVDLAKLQGQPFFKNAQLQDKVIIYSTAGKAILYRPSQHQIVEVAPFNAPAAPTPVPATTTPKSVK